MKTLAFFGGSSLSELGPASDVRLFFDCINQFAVSRLPRQDWSVLTDRLYRRYVRFEELASAGILMAQVRRSFEDLPKSSVDWGDIRSSTSVTRLDPTRPTLAEIFETFFERFAHCKESAELFFETFQILEPIRIVTADIPQFMIDKRRPLSEYDRLDGSPFWIQGHTT